MLLFLMTLTIEEANSLVAKKIPLGPVVNGRKMLLKVENTQFPKQHVNFGEETFVSNKLLVTIHVVYNEHPSQALFSRLLGLEKVPQLFPKCLPRSPPKHQDMQSNTWIATNSKP